MQAVKSSTRVVTVMTSSKMKVKIFAMSMLRLNLDSLWSISSFMRK